MPEIRLALRPQAIEAIKCKLGCGWFRGYHAQHEWLNRTIGHPLYGVVTNRKAMLLDIQGHVCDEHRKAVQRLYEKHISQAEEDQAE